MIHYQRCRICGHEVETELGPEAFSTAAYLLAEHIRGHTSSEIVQWALLSHGVAEKGIRTVPTVDEIMAGPPVR